MKKIVALVLGILTICAVSAVSFARPHHVNMQPTTISEVKANGWDDQRVVIEGKFTKQIWKDKYNFVDTQGNEIIAEVDDDCWYQLSMDTPVRIYAEVDRDWPEGVELEVKRIEKL